jgi:hypothetical protein
LPRGVPLALNISWLLSAIATAARASDAAKAIETLSFLIARQGNELGAAVLHLVGASGAGESGLKHVDHARGMFRCKCVVGVEIGEAHPDQVGRGEQRVE